MKRNRAWQGRLIAAALVAAAACGDGDNGNGSPTTPSGPSAGPSGATITIGSSGTVAPSAVTINSGQSVTFVNNDSRAHQISSDPHPTHTACPSFNVLGNIPAGATRVTNAFSGTGTCGFHDHNDPDNPGLRGSVTVQ